MLEQRKTYIVTNFHFERVLHFKKNGDCGPQTADCGPGVKCRLRVKRRLGAKCRIKTADFFKHLIVFLLLQISEIASRYQLHPSLRSRSALHIRQKFQWTSEQLKSAYLICNTFIEGHLNFLHNIFLCCWNDYYSLFYRYNSSCTVFWVSSFHLSVNMVVLYQLTVPGHAVSKTSRLKSKREV